MQDVDIPYVSLTHTLKLLKQQVIDSLPYMSDYIPSDISNPEDLFYFLKTITKYRNDPKNIELLQMVPTLMDRGGKGDCDCFTILTLASCIYLGFKPNYVNLVGRKRIAPTHIYSSVYDRSRNLVCAMDLTNASYNMERPYNYIQTLNFKI